MSGFLSEAEISEAIAWRRALHRRPETAFEENETARFIAEKLAEWGYDVRTGHGRTGVVGSLTRGTSSRAIGIRADMDALPIQEAGGVAHASETPGKMHACGHDGHVGMALAAARACGRLDFDGTVRFIFQPAEETEGGGLAMVEDGLFRDFPVDAVYALHNWPGEDVGTCVARDGAMMAAFAVFEIEVTGKGSHAAMPHEGGDCVVASAHIVSALQTIASRDVSPLRSAVISVTQMHGGDTWNVIPEKMAIRGTTRWFDAEVGKTVADRMERIASSVARGFGCAARLRYDERYPATINTPGNARFIRELAASPELGLKVLEAAPSMASEDFAFMLRERPGCYFWLGGRRHGENPGLHSPYYDFNDRILPIGANFWVMLVKTSLAAT